MRIVIAGGHGQIALHLERLLAEHGDQPVGLVRNADHADDLAAAGAETAVVDLESDTVETLADILAGADAAVFAAGAGPDSGVERKKTVDLGGAILLANAVRASPAYAAWSSSRRSAPNGPTRWTTPTATVSRMS